MHDPDIDLRNSQQRVFARVRGSEGGIPRKNQRKAKCSNVFLDIAKQYCATTVLHGCKYLSEPRRPVYERVAWFFILWGFLIVALYLIWITTEASLAKPVIINLDTSYHPIQNYQFPGLSFCPLNKINKTLAEDWAKSVKLPPYLNSSALLEILPNLLHLIEPIDIDEKTEILHSVLELNNVTAHSVFQKVATQCKDFLAACKFKNKMTPCTSLFRMSRTVDGFCCSFNYFGLRAEYNMNVYHVETAETPRDPVKLRTSGREFGLTVLLRTPEKDNFATLLSSTGTKLLIHKPTNYPDNLEIDKLIETGRAGYFSVNPEIINASDDVRRVSPTQRKCLFWNEQTLNVVQSYSYKNCIFNCRIKLYMKLCGCVPFMYPAPENHRVCNLLDAPCLARNRYQLRTLGRNYSIDAKQRADVLQPCNCRPQCNDVTYLITKSEGRMYLDEESQIMNEFYENMDNISEYSEISVYFQSLFSTRYERLVYHNGYRLLASFGGLLGLFFGFSFVASFEAVYFFTLRVLFHFYMSGNKKGEKEKAPPSPTTVLGLYSRFSPAMTYKERKREIIAEP